MCRTHTVTFSQPISLGLEDARLSAAAPLHLALWSHGASGRSQPPRRQVFLALTSLTLRFPHNVKRKNKNFKALTRIIANIKGTKRTQPSLAVPAKKSLVGVVIVAGRPTSVSIWRADWAVKHGYTLPRWIFSKTHQIQYIQTITPRDLIPNESSPSEYCY